MIEDVRIGGLSSDGSGVARRESGQVVFVPRSAPGDLATVRVRPSRRRWTRGRLQRVLEPGRDRRSPRCSHYARCGGCSLQHVAYEVQLDAKRERVAESLLRIGALEASLVAATVPCPEEYGYRRRAAFEVRRVGGRVFAGYHELDRPDRVVDVARGCPVLVPRLEQAWLALRAWWGPGARRLPGGARLRLELDDAGLGVTLRVSGGKGPGDLADLEADLPLFTEVRCDAWDAVAEPGSGGPTRAFRQANLHAEPLLWSVIAPWVDGFGGRRAVDAYSGTGWIARRLTELGAVVTAIEWNPEAVARARRTVDAVVEGAVERHLPSHLPADLVVVNPPRQGCHAHVCASLVACPPELLVYVSCDPATLARDARRLAPALNLVAATPVDLFPQTAHVEVVSVFQPVSTRGT